MKNNIIPIVYYRTNFMNTYFLLKKIIMILNQKFIKE